MSWQSKVRSLLKHGDIVKYMRYRGIPDHHHGTVQRQLEEKVKAPRDEIDVVKAWAHILQVSPFYLMDDTVRPRANPPPPQAQEVAETVINLLPDDQRALVLALGDEKKRAYLLGCLHGYDERNRVERERQRRKRRKGK